MNNFSKYLEVFLTLFFVAIAAIFLLSSIGKLGGVEILRVRTGSMEPAIPTGSLIASWYTDIQTLISPIVKAKYEKGDIVVYENESGFSVTHRVIGVINKEGNYYYETKGDANKNPDSEMVSQDQVIGKVNIVLPYFGKVIDYMRTPAGYILLILIPSLSVIVRESYSLISALRKRGAGVATSGALVLLLFFGSCFFLVKSTFAYFNDGQTNFANTFITAEVFPPPENPWEGDVRSMGYWKNHEDETSEDNPWISENPKGDYCQILENQMFAFYENWQKNPEFEGVLFQDTIFYSSGEFEDYDRTPISAIWQNAQTTAGSCSSDNKEEREETLELKDVLDKINNGEYIRYF